MKGGNANRVQALTTLVENQLQATADLVANMKTAKTEIEAIDLLGQQISHDVEAPSREVWKLRKLDQKDALDRLAKLEESLNQLGKCQVTAEEGSIERTEINRAIAKGASLIVRYRISIAQKSSDDILQELDNIRFDEELSLPEINKNLEALNQKLNNLQDFLTQAKINEKNIEEISNNLKGTISTDRRLINGIGFSTQEINLVLKELDNYEGGKFDQALQNVIISLNNASKGWKESKDKNHYSHHFEKLLNQLHTVNNLHQWRVKQGILDYKRPEGWKLSYW